MAPPCGHPLPLTRHPKHRLASPHHLWGHCMKSAAGFPPCWPGALGDNERQRQGLRRALSPSAERGLAGRALSCGKAAPLTEGALASGASPFKFRILISQRKPQALSSFSSSDTTLCAREPTPLRVLQGRPFCLVCSARMEVAKLGGRGEASVLPAASPSAHTGQPAAALGGGTELKRDQIPRQVSYCQSWDQPSLSPSQETPRVGSDPEVPS